MTESSLATVAIRRHVSVSSKARIPSLRKMEVWNRNRTLCRTREGRLARVLARSRLCRSRSSFISPLSVTGVPEHWESSYLLLGQKLQVAHHWNKRGATSEHRESATLSRFKAHKGRMLRLKFGVVVVICIKLAQSSRNRSESTPRELDCSRRPRPGLRGNYCGWCSQTSFTPSFPHTQVMMVI